LVYVSSASPASKNEVISLFRIDLEETEEGPTVKGMLTWIIARLTTLNLDSVNWRKPPDFVESRETSQKLKTRTLTNQRPDKEGGNTTNISDLDSMQSH
jgi:hypothetical protein